MRAPVSLGLPYATWARATLLAVADWPADMQPYRVVQKRVLNEKYGQWPLLRTVVMKVVVVDLSSDLGLALKSIEVALAAAKATESRARELLALARTSPEFFAKSRGIYERAGARVRRLERALGRMTENLS